MKFTDDRLNKIIDDYKLSRCLIMYREPTEAGGPPIPGRYLALGSALGIISPDEVEARLFRADPDYSELRVYKIAH